MKNIAIIIVTIFITWGAVSIHNSITGTRAKSDDRADSRVKGIEKSKIAIENAKLDNTVKTQAKTIEDSKATDKAKDILMSAYIAKNNKQTVLIGKLTRQLVNSQAANTKLSAKLAIKKRVVNPKYTTRKRTVQRKPVTKRKTNSEKKAGLIKYYKDKITKANAVIKEANNGLRMINMPIKRKDKDAKKKKAKLDIRRANAIILDANRRIARLR